MTRVNPYKKEIEEQMRELYQSLSEKDRRHYSAVEANKIGYGGVIYIFAKTLK